jgi:hypothetical protein
MAYLGNNFSQQSYTPATDFFSGNGVTTTFTLTRPVQSVYGLEVIVNNVQQNPSNTYTLNAAGQLVFVAAPSAGTNNIYVNYNAPISQINSIGQGTVQSSALAGPNAPSWDTSGNLIVVGGVVAIRPENVQTTNYTLALTDNSDVVAMNNSSAATITVPPNSSVAFPIGTVIWIARVGAGTVTLAAGAGVTLTKTGNMSLYEEIYVRKRGTDTWIVVDAPTKPVGSGGSLSVTGGYNVYSFTNPGSSNFTLT